MQLIVYYNYCAIIILAILRISLVTKKNIERLSNHVLKHLITMALSATIADTIAAFVQNSGDTSFAAIVAVFVANTAFFFCHNMILPLFVMYVYVSLDRWFIIKKRGIVWIAWIGLLAFEVFLLFINIFNKCLFYVDENARYQRGPLTYLLYIAAGIYAVWGWGVVWKYRKIAGKAKHNVLFASAFAVLVSEIVQIYKPELLVVNFGFALVALMYVMMIQRGENPVDPLTGAMKYTRALSRVMNSYSMGRPFVAIFVKVTNSNNIRMYLGDDRYSKFLNAQANEIRRLSMEEKYDLDIYYLENGEFALYVDSAKKSDAHLFASKLYDYYDEPFYIDNLEVRANAAICIVGCPEDEKNPDALVTLSVTFYEILGIQKGIVDFANHKGNISLRLHNQLGYIIRDALDNNKLEMYYQPIYSISEKRYIGAEALLRLHNEEYGDISPAVFIPAAEASGQIHELGDFVFESVLKLISSVDMDSLGLKYIQTNLSASQCIEADLVEKIIKLLDKYDVAANYLSMELTESVADINPQIVDNNIKKLSKLGIRFALDDYGVGYSNIRRVTNLPFSQVKLDKSFTKESDNPLMWEIIKDTISMFKDMKREILVEGIENEEVAKRFAEVKIDLMQGCDLLQGFYFCRPMPADKFIEFIEAYKN